MRRMTVLFVSIGLLVGGCSSLSPSAFPGASPTISQTPYATECERSGGVWRTQVGICEAEGTDD